MDRGFLATLTHPCETYWKYPGRELRGRSFVLDILAGSRRTFFVYKGCAIDICSFSPAVRVTSSPEEPEGALPNTASGVASPN